MNIYKIAIVFLILLTIPISLDAFGIDDSLTVYELQDTNVVVADRYKLPLKDMTYTHQVIPGELVSKYGTHSALELVDMAFPSAFTLDKKVIGYGVGPAGGGSVNIRGQGGKPNSGLLVLINGHPDIMGLFGHPLPDVYGVDEMEQVEILAGPASTVFGSNAMGGVINMKTRPDYNKWLRFSAEGGSFNTYNFGLSLNTMINDWGFFISARHNKTDGHIDKTGFESYRIQGGLEYKINPIWNLFVEGRYVPYSFDDPSRGDNDPAGIDTYGKIKRATGEIILKNKTNKLTGSTQLYGNWGHHRFYDGFDGRDYTYGLSSYQQWHTSDVLNFSAGFDLINYGGKAKNELAPPGVVNDDEQNLKSAGIYVLGFYRGLKKFNFNFGVRYQTISLPEQNISPVLGITYSVIPQFQLYTNYQNGFRYPTINELYLLPPRNPDLVAENLNSVEVGLRYYWSSNNSIRLSYYYNDVDNIIQLIPNSPPPPPVRYANSGEAIQHGVETQIHMALTKNLALQINYSYLDPDEITAYNPKHQFKYALIYQWQMLQVSAYGRYVDALFADNNHNDQIPDYHVLNMRIGVTIKQWDIYLKLRNVLDRLYYVEPDYPAPRFFVLAGVNLGL
jgi:iron complex outermembrane receptor protein